MAPDTFLIPTSLALSMDRAVSKIDKIYTGDQKEKNRNQGKDIQVVKVSSSGAPREERR